MITETVDGRRVYLRRTKSGWAVKWGRTIISHHKSALDAVGEIINMYKRGYA